MSCPILYPVQYLLKPQNDEGRKQQFDAFPDLVHSHRREWTSPMYRMNSKIPIFSSCPFPWEFGHTRCIEWTVKIWCFSLSLLPIPIGIWRSLHTRHTEWTVKGMVIRAKEIRGSGRELEDKAQEKWEEQVRFSV